MPVYLGGSLRLEAVRLVEGFRWRSLPDADFVAIGQRWSASVCHRFQRAVAVFQSDNALPGDFMEEWPTNRAVWPLSQSGITGVQTRLIFPD